MDNELRAELRRRVAADQEARRALDSEAVMAGQHAPEPMRVPWPACETVIEAWPPDVDATCTAACRECGLVLTFRLGD